MAKQQFGINDGFRGAVGTVIGYQWNGRWCMRSRPRRVHNPRTERQQQNRGLFAAASKLATAMGGVLRMGLKEAARAEHRTVFNHFLSINAECFTLDEGQFMVDYEHLVVSEGTVAPVGFGSAIVNGRTLTVPFERNPLHLRSDSNDKVYLWAWCPERMEGCLSLPVYRRSRQVSIELPTLWEGLEVHLYGFVEDYAGRTSDSVYLGRSDWSDLSDLSAELLSTAHNKKSNDALEVLYNKNNVYETYATTGSYSGAYRNGLGADTAEGCESDARGREGGGS